MAKTMSTRLEGIVVVTRAKRTKKAESEVKRYRVSRWDESYCYVEAVSPEAAIMKSGDGNADVRWNVNIGDEEAEVDE